MQRNGEQMNSQVRCSTGCIDVTSDLEHILGKEVENRLKDAAAALRNDRVRLIPDTFKSYTNIYELALIQTQMQQLAPIVENE